MAGLKFDDWDWTGAETEARQALKLNEVATNTMQVS